jgi:hypothetical protein
LSSICMLKIHVSKLLTALVNGQLATALIVVYLTSTLEKVQSLYLTSVYLTGVYLMGMYLITYIS